MQGTIIFDIVVLEVGGRSFCFRPPVSRKSKGGQKQKDRPHFSGRNYFEEKKVEYNQKKDEQVELISKQVGFIK